jgi:hypothetical protein
VSDELLLGGKRYEKARKLTPFQWNRLHIRNLAGESFDAMIDSLPEPSTPVPASIKEASTHAVTVSDMPTLPQSLLNLIGEYGMARTDGVSQLEIQHRWLQLIAGIKTYALATHPATGHASLTAADITDLKHLRDVFDDGEGWDIPKDRMMRLAELGAVRWRGRNFYSIAAFGLHCLDGGALPLRTVAEINSQAFSEMQARNATGIQPGKESRNG